MDGANVLRATHAIPIGEDLVGLHLTRVAAVRADRQQQRQQRLDMVAAVVELDRAERARVDGIAPPRWLRGAPARWRRAR